LSIEINY